MQCVCVCEKERKESNNLIPHFRLNNDFELLTINVVLQLLCDVSPLLIRLGRVRNERQSLTQLPYNTRLAFQKCRRQQLSNNDTPFTAISTLDRDDALKSPSV
jgi:hypothetical protein